MSGEFAVGAPVSAARIAELSTALTGLRERITAACAAAGRSPDSVALLPVTKYFPASDVAALYGLGCRDFGESREQEATAKVAALALGHKDIRWHMIGRLQRNKVKSVAGWAYSVHSVDSDRLLTALDTAAAAALDTGRRAGPLRVLLQVSLDADPTRGGLASEELSGLADRVAESASLQLAGLMAVPPIDVEPDRAFAELAEIHDRLLRVHPAATELSAGMSSDLEAAIRHGSTCVRVGTALMGARPITSG
ncbi:YggS family pyridoxal phosphate-dependent enzyme [Nocardia stercoris]|uniref:Pyridoxal phosphate homeostasis protein n=1 Tax=Nocardia stercoris TaxID=2483361 RepID=A0A3M2KU09_9NOCA|nr:YggS family pyridoxal phosphate-dependent enzyme [Nocardia stercoris]RMI29132.1 YggS family pyridoxal phosphate-dependent enzyme [Nocardia stercoris]